MKAMLMKSKYRQQRREKNDTDFDFQFEWTTWLVRWLKSVTAINTHTHSQSECVLFNIWQTSGSNTPIPYSDFSMITDPIRPNVKIAFLWCCDTIKHLHTISDNRYFSTILAMPLNTYTRFQNLWLFSVWVFRDSWNCRRKYKRDFWGLSFSEAKNSKHSILP